MSKFIKGTFELDKNISDWNTYVKLREAKIVEIIDWSYRFKVVINIGTTDDNALLCEYKVVAKTKAMCNGLLRELKEMLKDCFPYVKLIWQGSGDCW